MNMDLAPRSLTRSAVMPSIATSPDEASTVAALKVRRDKHGVARILVNCAGIGGAHAHRRQATARCRSRISRKIVKVNLIGTFNVTRLFAAGVADDAEPLEAGERGIIIMTASVAAFEGQIGQAAYAASKGGIAR